MLENLQQTSVCGLDSDTQIVKYLDLLLEMNWNNKVPILLKKLFSVLTCASLIRILHASVSYGYEAILLSAFTTLSAM